MAPRRRPSQPTDGNSTGQVYGPRSALTSFLREQGITGPGANVTYINRRQGTLQRSPSGSNSPAPAASANNTDGGDTDVTLTVASPSTSTDGNAEASSSTAGNAEAGPSSASSTKRKASKPLTAAQAKKKKAKEAEEFSVGGSALPQPKKGRYEERKPGQIKVCAECGKKFTVSKYTATHPSGTGLLCAPCTNESIEERASFPSAAKPKAPPKPKRKQSEKQEKETKYTPVETLGQSCLSIIASLISSVESGAFSYLGPKNLDRVAKIVSKNRALDGENLKLFLEVGHRELRLYDCTNIPDTALSSISTFSPHLHSLTLRYCGRLDDDVLRAWSTPPNNFPELEELELYAPYLATAKGWKEFFEKRKVLGGRGLRGFRLRMSARFTDLSLSCLISSNPSLSYLQLSEIGKLTPSSLSLVYPLGHQLTRLDISRFGTPQGQVLEDEHVEGLLREVGREVRELVLDGNTLLTSLTLTHAIAPHCRALESLSLADLSLIDAEGFEEFFTGVRPAPMEEEQGEDEGKERGEGEGQGAEGGEGGDVVPPDADAVPFAPTTANGDDQDKEKTASPPPSGGGPPLWSPRGLTLLNAHRLSLALTPSSFSSLLSHSSSTLRHLNLHSCDALLPESLTLLAQKAKGLEVVDVSFVRAVDNFVVKDLVEGCEGMRVLFVHCCNRVTSDVQKKAGVQIRGLENAVHSEIPCGILWEY
ncbi:hypothetical protein JCM8547_008457 [Rhodosporidiobolus lusitaniae]